MNELTRRSLVERFENIILDYEQRQLSEIDVEDLNYEELKCISESLQFAQLKAEKSGEWVITVKKGNNYQWYTTCHCSECEEIYENAQNHHSETDRVCKGFFPNIPEDIIHSVLIANTKSMKLKNYCPNCGAKMKKRD